MNPVLRRGLYAAAVFYAGLVVGSSFFSRTIRDTAASGLLLESYRLMAATPTGRGLVADPAARVSIAVGSEFDNGEALRSGHIRKDGKTGQYAITLNERYFAEGASPAIIAATLAHELTHYRQGVDGSLGDWDAYTIEDEYEAFYNEIKVWKELGSPHDYWFDFKQGPVVKAFEAGPAAFRKEIRSLCPGLPSTRDLKILKAWDVHLSGAEARRYVFQEGSMEAFR
jgi:hypothetical protein